VSNRKKQVIWAVMAVVLWLACREGGPVNVFWSKVEQRTAQLEAGAGHK